MMTSSTRNSHSFGLSEKDFVMMNDDLADLRAHINSMAFVGHNPWLCVVCGKKRCHWF